MNKATLVAIAEKIAEEAVDLIPVAVKALEGLFEGKPPEQVLSRAERDALAQYSQKRFDAALARGKGKPNTGT